MGIFGGKKKKGDESGFVPIPIQEPKAEEQTKAGKPGSTTHKTSKAISKKNTGAVVGSVNPSSPVTTSVTPKGRVVKPGEGSSFPKDTDTAVPASEIHPLYDPHSEVPVPSYTGGSFFSKKPAYVYKRLVEKKLTIILIEDTKLVMAEKDKLVQIVKKVTAEGKACIITYGDVVRQSEIFEVLPNSGIPFPVNENVGDMARLYDALIAVEKLVLEKHTKTEETETQRILIKDVDVIGIGTCTDNGSEATKEDALGAFHRVTSRSRVMTKYFCLTEESFLNSAEVGFRSIGAISKNYQ